MNPMRLSRHSEERLHRYHRERDERFNRALTPVLVITLIFLLVVLWKMI